MAFERLGIAKYFDRIFTCEEVGAGKTKPDIYLRAAEYLGTHPEETVVFEDVIHAIRSAKQAGFQVVGIYDETSKDDQEEVRREADWYCREWAELMKKRQHLQSPEVIQVEVQEFRQTSRRCRQTESTQ